MATEKENHILPTERTTNNTSNTPSIIDLTPKMQRFVQLYMTGQYKMNKLAQLLEVHPNTITNWLKRDDIQAVIADTQATTHKIVSTRLNALTTNAVNRLAELIDSPIDGVALQAVNSILDRGGHRSKQEIKVDKTITTYEQKLQDVIEKTIDVDFDNYTVLDVEGGEEDNNEQSNSNNENKGDK